MSPWEYRSGLVGDVLNVGRGPCSTWGSPWTPHDAWVQRSSIWSCTSGSIATLPSKRVERKLVNHFALRTCWNVSHQKREWKLQQRRFWLEVLGSGPRAYQWRNKGLLVSLGALCTVRSSLCREAFQHVGSAKHFEGEKKVREAS